MEYNIREARLEDLSQVFICIESLYCEMSQFAELYNEPNLPRLREILEARIRSKTSVVLILECDGRINGVIIGFLSRYDGLYVSDFGGTVGKLTELYLSPEARGQSFAELLIGKAEEWFRECGVKMMQADIFIGNGKSERLFNKAGYSPLYNMIYKRI